MRNMIREWIGSLLEAGIIVVILFFVFWPMKVQGISMEETFHSGDRVAISKLSLYIKDIQYGDVIVCSYEENGKEQRIIKRVIGVGGDHMIIRDGIVIRNDEIVQEPYAIGYTEGKIDMIVPEESIFIMGDNREISKDSRIIGPISLNQVEGRVVVRWFPLGQMKIFK